MRAWVCTELTGEDGLVFREQGAVSCGPGQVLVRTHCVALNFPDVLITRGKYQMKLDPPFVPGSELSGEVIAVGEGVTEIALGQRVLAMTGFGAFAEEVLVEQIFAESQKMRYIPQHCAQQVVIWT